MRRAVRKAMHAVTVAYARHPGLYREDRFSTPRPHRTVRRAEARLAKRRLAVTKRVFDVDLDPRSADAIAASFAQYVNETDPDWVASTAEEDLVR